MTVPDSVTDFVREWWRAVEGAFGTAGSTMPFTLPGGGMPDIRMPFQMSPSARGAGEAGQPGAEAATAAMHALQALTQLLTQSYAALGGPIDIASRSLLPFPGGAYGPASNPYLAGLERTFGAVADAFGMGPPRAMADAWQELLRTDQQKRQAGAQYLAVVTGAWNQVPGGVVAEMEASRQRGELVDSFIGWVRLWARVAEAKLHDAMQSPAGLEATAAYVRAGARYRQQQNRLVELISEYHGIPTRSQLDDAYFEIQQLKRELRALQRERRAPQVAGDLPTAPRPTQSIARRKRHGATRGKS